MQIRYPNLKTYEVLYAKYLDGNRMQQLMDLAGDIKHKVFMDICCGGGRLTREAIKRKTHKNIMIDFEGNMVAEDFYSSNDAHLYIMTVEEAFKTMLLKYNTKIDIAMCQQGINYWLSYTLASQLSRLINRGGVFIFNTFNEKPSETPTIKEYTITPPGKHYIEISWLTKGYVQHVQICEGYPPHFTQFMWMNRDYIVSCLAEFFDIEETQDKKTSIYKCTRK